MILEAAALIVGAFVLGALVPWMAMRMLVPALQQSNSIDNYRGRPVFLGLGSVWVIWAGCAIVGGVAASAAGLPTVLPILALAGLLALVAFSMGVVDDAYGSRASRGFRGHLAALAHGRLTTGGLKLIGIGSASLVVALVMAQVAPWGEAPLSFAAVSRALVAGAAIALTSNFVNLTDLRPGRAIKVYSLLAMLGVLSTAWLLGSSDRGTLWGMTSGQQLLDGIALAIFALGPVVAVWHFDVGEMGMLGDAGANPMGAVAGLLIVSGMPLWGLVAYAAVMFALNLASERFSYSRVIEQSAVLRWFDRLGRLPDEEQGPAGKSSQQRDVNAE